MSKRGALVVGIDHYPYIEDLRGCVNDACAMETLLSRHGNGDRNFDVILRQGAGPNSQVSQRELRNDVTKLFGAEGDIALFYFAGHGHVESSGGYLSTSDAKAHDEGLPLSEILILANKGRAKNRIVILDSCFSGKMGEDPIRGEGSLLAEGVSILTACSKKQTAVEEAGSGVFTTLLRDALNGAAANLVGEVSPGAVYAHIDQSLGFFGQRPIFKTNVREFVSLRSVEPPISRTNLRKLSHLFPEPNYIFPLSPAFEWTSPEAEPGKVEIFKVLQRYNRVGLLEPIGTPDMYFAAMESKAAKLTAVGEHYRRLAAANRL